MGLSYFDYIGFISLLNPTFVVGVSYFLDLINEEPNTHLMTSKPENGERDDQLGTYLIHFALNPRQNISNSKTVIRNDVIA